MKQLFLIDLDTHAIVPRKMTDEQLMFISPIHQTWNKIRNINTGIIEKAAPVKSVTCETCSKVTCTQEVAYEDENRCIGFQEVKFCSAWEPKT